jgi:hypothetical protein
MILELQQFYHAKSDEITKCKQACKELCQVTQLLCDNLNQKIDYICEKTREYKHAPPEHMLAHVANFGGSLKYEQLFINEELFGLQFSIGLIEQDKKRAIDLANYKSREPTGQVMTSYILLRTVLQDPITSCLTPFFMYS